MTRRRSPLTLPGEKSRKALSCGEKAFLLEGDRIQQQGKLAAGFDLTDVSHIEVPIHEEHQTLSYTWCKSVENINPFPSLEDQPSVSQN